MCGFSTEIKQEHVKRIGEYDRVSGLHWDRGPSFAYAEGTLSPPTKALPIQKRDQGMGYVPLLSYNHPSLRQRGRLLT